jgi:TatD DNase family protein
MFVDSHCHLDRIDLNPYNQSFAEFVADAAQKGVLNMLCISIDLEAFPAMRDLVMPYPNIWLSAGVHPNNTHEGQAFSMDALLAVADTTQVIAIGETGLDYFHGKDYIDGQREFFKQHIEVAKILRKPLIVHTREAGQEALDILRAEGADQVGGIIHCFTEDWAFAEKALDLNFYVSFSGIVTFKNAVAIQEVAKKIPGDRFLIETDSPYLAPMPFRGKPNYPTYLPYVAQKIAELRGTTVEEIAKLSSANFFNLFAAQLQE